MHPLTFHFNLAVGMMEQDKTGSSHYVYCPSSKVGVSAFGGGAAGTFCLNPRSAHLQGVLKTRVDRHRRFVLTIEQTSYQPMIFESARRIGISPMPWQSASGWRQNSMERNRTASYFVFSLLLVAASESASTDGVQAFDWLDTVRRADSRFFLSECKMLIADAMPIRSRRSTTTKP